MKNLTKSFREGNLRPKERVLLQVHNEVAKDETGKEILTKADIYALGEGWRAGTNEEAREYNQYIEGWRLMNTAEIDAQTTYLGTTTALLRAGRLVDMAVSKDGTKALEYCKNFKENLEDKEGALALVLKNSGLELKYVVHRHAFESLSEDMKKDLLALCPDAKTEIQYLDQEESIAGLFDGKRALSKEAKERLADLIVDSLRNKNAALFTKLKAKDELREPYFFSGYYAELPALEILNKWAVYNGQMPKEAEDLLKHLPDDKEYANESEEVNDLFAAIRKELVPKLTDYAKKYNKDMGELLKETLLRWLDDGLFTKDFAPIWNSNGKDTCNGADTKLPHKDVLKKWLKAKRAAQETIDGLIAIDELKIENRVEIIKSILKSRGIELGGDDYFQRPLTLITGESLYALKGDYAFARDYRKQADDLEGLGALILFLRERSFLNQYGVMLAFVELFKRLSKIYDIDLTYKVSGFPKDFIDDIEMMNGEILRIGEMLRQASYEKHSAAFLIEVLVEDMLIDLEKIPTSRGRAEKYSADLEQNFGGEFESYE